MSRLGIRVLFGLAIIALASGMSREGKTSCFNNILLTSLLKDIRFKGNKQDF